jgi:hypothetical protein
MSHCLTFFLFRPGLKMLAKAGRVTEMEKRIAVSSEVEGKG